MREAKARPPAILRRLACATRCYRPANPAPNPSPGSPNRSLQCHDLFLVLTLSLSRRIGADRLFARGFLDETGKRDD